ncbi:hypothetical protein AB0K16_45170 [Nonomuraea jabiensis]|uniref:hypothetical protein n=1 Tax=Nonomuraea jabiensis TaxID=882448 RepID=UPI00342C112D
MRKHLPVKLAIAAAITLSGLASATPATAADDDTGIFHRYATQAECRAAGEAMERSYVCVYRSVYALPWELRLS